MNYEEFAFFNQQLAAMLRDGIPLEGALLRLSKDMRDGKLRAELEALAADLSRGTPLREASRARQLPPLYSELLEVGVRGNDLPATLTFLADYYQRRHLIWVRLKGLMVYPVIVLFCAFSLACFLCAVVMFLEREHVLTVFQWNGWNGRTPPIFYGLFGPPVFLGVAFFVVLALVAVPGWRRVWRWRFPAFKEASVAQAGMAMSLLLKSGVPLDEALSVLQQLETGTPAEADISTWRKQLSEGRGRFVEMASSGKVFPPLFVWMVANAGDDLSAGFRRASEVYQSRANYRTEMLLYSALPCAIFLLGVMLISEITPLVGAFVSFMQMLGNDVG